MSKTIPAGTNYLARTDGKPTFITNGTMVTVVRDYPYGLANGIKVGMTGKVIHMQGRNPLLGKYQNKYGKAVLVEWV